MSKKSDVMYHVQVHQKHMFVVANGEERICVAISRNRGRRRVRGGVMSVNSVVKTQHGVIGGTIEF